MKNIVICCDGTGSEYGSNNTNVVETFQLVEKDAEQVSYYDPGVGTGGWEYHEGATGKLRAMSDKATGTGLQRNVEDAYRRLMQCYESGDRVFLFGFSRGAFTVRSLAGMLHKCGLLSPGHENLLEYASKVYNTEGNDEIAAGFRSTFGRRCPVEFIGVWDTVESLALNAGKRWHDRRLNPEVSFGYHALAIDERRNEFKPCPWDETEIADGQTIEQVWFAGVHSDVGGWYEERGLSNIALHWMLCKAEGCGLRVDQAGLDERRPDPHDKLHRSRTGIWRAFPSGARKIPEGAQIHRSVFERMKCTRVSYNPKNLPDNHVVVD